MAVFERTTLSNGIRVLTAPMPQAQSVSCFVMFAAGSRYETPDIGGIAHFAEHMFFKGTERRPTARDISAEIDGIGGEFNAFTGKEYTGYYVKCAAGTRDIALDVLVDMIRNSRFDAEEIEREKGVIVEEMNMYFDTPRDFVGGVYDELLYGDHPLGRDIIGTKESVRAATRETFTSFIDRWYRPERTVIGVGGRIGDDLNERLEELLGSIEPRETGMPEPAAAPPNGSPVSVFTKQSDQAHIVLGARSYPLGHPDRFTLQLLTTVLGGGHVVAPLHRGARAPRARLLRVQHERELHRCRLALRAGGRRHPAHRRCRLDDRRRAAADGGGARAGRPSSRRPARSRRAGSCSASRAPTARSCTGSGARCSSARPRSPRRCSRVSTPSPWRTSSASPQDIVGKQLKLAVIGPFEDAERFERLLEPA